jgi:hypothetical protein
MGKFIYANKFSARRHDGKMKLEEIYVIDEKTVLI